MEALRRAGNQNDRELIAAVLQNPAALDFVGRWPWVGEKFINDVRRGSLFGVTTEKYHPVFHVTRLPCLQEMICGRKSERVTTVESAWFGPGRQRQKRQQNEYEQKARHSRVYNFTKRHKSIMRDGTLGKKFGKASSSRAQDVPPHTPAPAAPFVSLLCKPVAS